MNSNHEQLIFDGKQYEAFLLDCIHECVTEILISCYIIESDAFGDRILTALIEKAKQGVKVCLLIDGFGSWVWINEFLGKINQENLEIRVYHPLTWKLLQISLKNIFWGMNKRNHQKLFIFDGKMATIGSRNINDKAISWRETNIVIQGPSVFTLCLLFSTLWKQAHHKLSERLLWRLTDATVQNIKESPNIFSNHRFTLRRQIQKNTLNKILGAKKWIDLTTPYFFPTNQVFRAVLKKAKSGVSVRLLLPNISDVFISKWISQYHYSKMMDAGVKIYELKSTILHAKSIMIDDWALVGSSNFNRRSVLRDLELDYAVAQSGTIDAMSEQFEKDLQQSVPVKSVPKLTIWKKIVVIIAIKIFPSWF